MVAVAAAVVVVAVVAEMEAKQLDLGSNPAAGVVGLELLLKLIALQYLRHLEILALQRQISPRHLYWKN